MLRFLAKQSHGLTNASLIIGGGAILSRFFGLLRDRILASQFGAGRELDIYYAAFFKEKAPRFSRIGRG